MGNVCCGSRRTRVQIPRHCIIRSLVWWRGPVILALGRGDRRIAVTHWLANLVESLTSRISERPCPPPRAPKYDGDLKSKIHTIDLWTPYSYKTKLQCEPSAPLLGVKSISARFSFIRRSRLIPCLSPHC